MAERASVKINLTAVTSRFQRGMAKVEAKLRKVQERMEGAAIVARRFLLVTGGVLGLAIKQASDYEESLSAFRAVFGSQAQAAEKWAKDTSKSLNRSEADLIEYLATFQDTFVPFGFARDEAAKLSKELTVLSEDLASFKNQKTGDTVRDLQSALVGNVETMRKYGVVISQTRLDQELMAMGIKGGTKEATEQQKVMGRLRIIMQGTSDAQGDAARTSDSLANMIKGLKGDLTNLGIELGKVFIPTVKEMISKLREWLPLAVKWVKDNHKLILTVTKVAGAIAGLVLATNGLLKVGLAIIPVLRGFGKVASFAASGPIGAITIALAAAAAAFIYLQRQIEETKQDLRDLEQLSKEMSDQWEKEEKAQNKLGEARTTEEELSALRDLVAVRKELVSLQEDSITQLRQTGADRSAITSEENKLEKLKRFLSESQAQLEELEQAEKGVQQQQDELGIQTQSLEDKIASFEKSLKEEIDTMGMAGAELERYKLVAEGATPEQLKLADALIKTKKAREEDAEAARKQEEAIEQGRDMIKDLTRELAVKSGLLTDEQIEIFDLENLGLTDKQLRKIMDLRSQIAEVEEQKAKEAEERKRVEEKIEASKRRQASFVGIGDLFKRIQQKAAAGRATDNTLAKATKSTSESTKAIARDSEEVKKLIKNVQESFQTLLGLYTPFGTFAPGA